MTAPSDFNSTPELDATLVFRVAYDGSSYSGFAEQPGQTTVAGELRRAIETLLRRPIDLTCAGRTDSGVHAVAQYISVPVTDAELALTRRRWLRAMDALLPKDIAINEVYKACKGFSARFDARSRTYTYRIADRDARPVLSRGAVWWHRYPLDVDAMAAACPALLGEQDFKSFCKVASAVGKPTHRCVMRAEFGHEVAFGEDILTFTIEGNAFLHSMVRTIVGTLVEIGMHRRDPEWMREVIDACDRTAAGPTAPACGNFERMAHARRNVATNDDNLQVIEVLVLDALERAHRIAGRTLNNKDHRKSRMRTTSNQVFRPLDSAKSNRRSWYTRAIKATSRLTCCTPRTDVAHAQLTHSMCQARTRRALP